MNANIQKLIPEGLEVIQKLFQPNEAKQKKLNIDKAYQSAFAAWGTSLIQMGLLPTLAVYSKDKAEDGIDKKMIVKAIFEMVLSEHSSLDEEIKKAFAVREKDFFQATQQLSSIQRKKLKKYLIESATVLKLCIRTYPLK